MAIRGAQTSTSHSSTFNLANSTNILQIETTSCATQSQILAKGTAEYPPLTGKVERSPKPLQCM